MDEYALLLAVLGIAVLAAAVLPRLVDRLPLSLPMIIVAAGVAIFSLPLSLEGPRPGADDIAAERLTEFVVIVSLMGAGLKLRRTPGWRSWSSTWRLLAITMPLTVAFIALAAGGVLGLPVAAAILLGAVLAPTDPVLASDVQLPGPGDEEEHEDGVTAGPSGEVRFALTSEAGLNDGLAFPITNLAIAIAAGGSWFWGWFVDDVVVKIAVGTLAGLVLGRIIGWAMFHPRSELALARSRQGFVALGATLAVYGLCELVHGYGFLAVFISAVMIRRHELDHDYHDQLHDFAESLERLASVLFLLLLGGAAVDGALRALTPSGLAVAAAIVLVIRPICGWIGMLGSSHSPAVRAAIAFFGIRGMGSVYYLAHAVNEERFPGAPTVWAIAVTTILISIVVHGISATPVLARLDASNERHKAEDRAASPSP